MSTTLGSGGGGGGDAPNPGGNMGFFQDGANKALYGADGRMRAGPQSVRAAQIESYARRTTGSPEPWTKLPHRNRFPHEVDDTGEPLPQFYSEEIFDSWTADWIPGGDRRRVTEYWPWGEYGGILGTRQPYMLREVKNVAFGREADMPHLPRPTSPTAGGTTRSGKVYQLFSTVIPKP